MTETSDNFEEIYFPEQRTKRKAVGNKFQFNDS